jgi:hypothetical protein
MTSDTDQNPNSDTGWTTLIIVLIVFWVCEAYFGERLDPLGNVHTAEKATHYLGKAVAPFLIPGGLIYLLHKFQKRRGRGMKKPKKAVLIAAIAIFLLGFGGSLLRGTSGA